MTVNAESGKRQETDRKQTGNRQETDAICKRVSINLHAKTGAVGQGAIFASSSARRIFACRCGKLRLTMEEYGKEIFDHGNDVRGVLVGH